MPNRVDRLLSATLTIAAAIIAVSVFHREFLAKPEAGVPRRQSRYVTEWRDMLAAAKHVGDRRAPVTIIEFADFQCPFCARFHKSLRTLRARFPDQVSLALVHFPLPSHPHARSAARAADCADESSQFGAMVDYLFEMQDSIGKKPWNWFAQGAGIKDLPAFGRCISDTSSLLSVEKGIQLGTRFEVTGTPTVLLNGWRFGVAPQDSELVRAVGDVVTGRRPYRGFPTHELRARK